MHSSTVLATNITSSLSLQLQCDEAKKKAMRVLGILQRNLSLCDQSVKAGSYLSLVYPIVEYAVLLFGLRIQIKGLTILNPFDAVQHVLLTAIITAAI